MKKPDRTIISWATKEDGKDLYVIIHSQEIDEIASIKASKMYDAERFVRGLVPQVYLDEKLNTPALRSYLTEESRRRNA